jgi:HlyD family secretion protein
LQIQIAQLQDQLTKCYINSPINGSVLVKYAECGELAMAGKALFKMADLNNMTLRAYVTCDLAFNNLMYFENYVQGVH